MRTTTLEFGGRKAVVNAVPDSQSVKVSLVGRVWERRHWGWNISPGGEFTSHHVRSGFAAFR